MNDWVKEPREQARTIREDIRDNAAIDDVPSVDEIEQAVDPDKPLAVNSQTIIDGLIDAENGR